MKRALAKFILRSITLQTGMVLDRLVPHISKILKVEDDFIYALVDEFQRNHWPDWLDFWIDRRVLNDYFIHNPELLNARVDRDVDAALSDYEAEVGTQDDIEIGSGTFYEKEPDGSKAQDLLGGEMGITADWRHNKGI